MTDCEAYVVLEELQVTCHGGTLEWLFFFALTTLFSGSLDMSLHIKGFLSNVSCCHLKLDFWLTNYAHFIDGLNLKLIKPQKVKI